MKDFPSIIDLLPRLNWIPAPVDSVAVKFSGMNLPLRKMPDGALVVQEKVDAGVLYWGVFDNKDHEFLSLLPSGAPRAAKAVLRRENRLKYLLAKDTGPFEDFEKASRAWNKFMRNQKP
jgi:hypothetical protein